MVERKKKGWLDEVADGTGTDKGIRGFDPSLYIHIYIYRALYLSWGHGCSSRSNLNSLRVKKKFGRMLDGRLKKRARSFTNRCPLPF